MDSSELPRLIYLVLLGTAVVGWFIAENRKNMSGTVRMALVWGMIFFGVVAAYGLWNDVSRDIMPRQAVLSDERMIEIPRRDDGHFHLTMHLNGVPIEFVVDTGATTMVLSLQDAQEVGLDPDRLAFIGQARTANGTVQTARATIDTITVGPVSFDDVRVAVNGGQMDGSLLGMSVLSRFDRLEIEGNTLRLAY